MEIVTATTPVTKENKNAYGKTSSVLIPAAVAVNRFAPWMTGSAESAIPCPNRFTAVAAAIAGRPICTATGKRTVPTKAIEEVGQKKIAARYMLNPRTKNAVHGPKIGRAHV